ncbi:MAG: hypothetical protein OJJ21_09750 [Ferrovibrio sp.]|uniref:hypothetical protein n=1 Tax=Ferrovibrio sp. TaxID=1917215 RepID=UPI00262D98D0|nr:hypothetical protein [Ferrovibrio sp.]MCW0233869.1 hypothetical protein [Ferrovibrio sp.]
MAEQPKPKNPEDKTPVGDPPNKDKPRITQRIFPAQQYTLEPGDHGRGTGSAHTEPLVKAAPAQQPYGRGTYGNDQFNAEHHDDFVNDRALPEGLCDPQEHVQGAPLRPTLKPKEKRYGRLGDEGKG